MATKLHPLVQQARAALAAGNLQAAAQACDQRLSMDANDLNAQLTLADVQLLGGHADMAIATLETVAAKLPNQPLVRVKLGRMLFREGRWKAALTACDKALKADPACVPALALKATVFERQDKYKKAERAIAGELKADRPHPDAGPPGMRILVHEGRLDEAVAFAERYQAANPSAGAMLREVLFELARAQERLGNIDASFDAASRANAINRPIFDRADHNLRMDAIRNVTTRDALSLVPTAEPGDDPIVFIVGMPRTGSTLTERILVRHPEVTGIGEHPAVHLAAYDLHNIVGGAPYPECLPLLTADAAEDVRAETLHTMRAAAGRGRVLVNKNLGNVLHVGFISRIFPEARIVIARRDPVDTCLSCFMEPLGGAGTTYASRLEDCGFYHRSIDRMIEHWQAESDLPMLELAYEDLVRDQQATTERLLEFCGLPWDDACLDFHQLDRPEQTLSFDQVRRPLYDASVGRAERFGGHLDPLRKALGMG